MDFFIHPQALVESEHIGRNTRINAFAHILKGAEIGEDCLICDHTFIENDVMVGNRVTIQCGVQLWKGVTIEDDVFIGPNVTFTNTHFPISHGPFEACQNTVVRQGASIGANATLLPGIEIGRSAVIGAGAVITRSVPPHAIVVGNPGRIIGYETTRAPQEAFSKEEEDVRPAEIAVRGVNLHTLPLIHDLRGDLSFAQFPDTLPFLPKRYFLVFDVASKEIRGEHAHRTLHQFLVCINGSCSVVVDDGARREEIVLDRRDKGLHIPPLVWGIQYKFTKDAVLMVLASDVYQAEDYIRDYDLFLATVREQENQ